MFKSIGQVANYKPVARCGMEELAARQKIIEPSGGVRFARNVDGEQKTAARQHILDLFHPDKWGKRYLNMLTMPGLFWRFERKLLAMREPGWTRFSKPRSTHFTGVESDRSIFFAGVAEMPGLHNPGSLLKWTKQFPFAEMGVKTYHSAFFFANIDDFMTFEGWANGWDAVWLDYTGPMSRERLMVIKQFYHRYVHEILIITVLNARWDKLTGEAIQKAGGHTPWLYKHLGGEVLHNLEYFDTSPMAQLALRKIKRDPALAMG